ncbi:hypothetical protein AtEden1_Chr1g0039201 [Arabidopsis thaliana]
MNSSDISIISEKMESMSINRVVRHNKKLPQSRYSPYSKETYLNIEKEMKKDEAKRLGVEFSLFVAEAMFLLSDDLRSMLLFCLWLLKDAGNKGLTAPVVVGREMDRIVSILGKRESSSCEEVKTSDLEHYNLELNKLEETLRSAKEVSEANGFAREAIKSNIVYLWKCLFETSQPNVINLKNRILDMFTPLLIQVREDACSRLIASLHI